MTSDGEQEYGLESPDALFGTPRSATSPSARALRSFPINEEEGVQRVPQGASELSAPTLQRIVPLRLQKFLARAGVASRRGSENLMTAGRVRVNGVVVTELGSKVDPTVDVVEVDGRVVKLADGPTTLVLNKPAGVITTMKAQSDKPIVADLVPTDRFPGLFPIGRLDADTTGLLLFSTDGELGNELLHPSKHVAKTYLVGIAGTLGARELARLREGLMLARKLDDGTIVEEGPTQPADVRVLGGGEERAARTVLASSAAAMHEAKHRRGTPHIAQVVGMTIHEGRYHQVKRMMEAVGQEVVALHRVSFGPLSLGVLEQGAWRLLDDDEVAVLKAGR